MRGAQYFGTSMELGCKGNPLINFLSYPLNERNPKLLGKGMENNKNPGKKIEHPS